MGEGTLDGVHREPLKVVKIPAECIGALGELSSHRGIAHQSIVSVQWYAAITHELREATKLFLAWLTGDVVHDAHTVAKSLSA